MDPHRPISLKNIRIPRPCSQNWDEMEDRGDHRFCKHCSKRVFDVAGKGEAYLNGLVAREGKEICLSFYEGEVRTGPEHFFKTTRNSFRGRFTRAASIAVILGLLHGTAVAAPSPKYKTESAASLTRSDTGPGRLITGVATYGSLPRIPIDVDITFLDGNRQIGKTTTRAGLFTFDLSGQELRADSITLVVHPIPKTDHGPAEVEVRTSRHTVSRDALQNIELKLDMNVIYRHRTMGVPAF